MRTKLELLSVVHSGGRGRGRGKTARCDLRTDDVRRASWRPLDRLRSMAYQYILVGYMADAQRGGFKAVHVWSSSSFGGGNYILRGGEQGFPDRALLDCYV